MKKINEIRSVATVNGEWLRVSGTRSNPKFDKVLVWAVLSVSERSIGEAELYFHPDVVVGLTVNELGTNSFEVDDVINTAGYVEISEGDLLKFKYNPKLLPDYLVWED